jgi:Domain of unknown function (DUF5666)
MSNRAANEQPRECEFTMIGAPMSHVSANWRRWRRWTPALAGLAALAVTACGGSGATAAAPPAASSNSSPAPASTNGQAAFPGVIGTAAAVSASSLEVQNPTNGQVTVTFTSATAITDEVAATSRAVTVGSCVTVTGQPPASGAASGAASGSATRSVTATTVTVSTPVNGNCNAGFGGGGGFGGPPGSFTPNPSFSARPRPSGSRGAFGGGFGGANGKVTSLSASGFVVQGRAPRAGATPGASASPGAGADIMVTVTTTATTKYTKVVTAKSSAFKVGECITAVGQANSIGAVAARTIRISQPGPNGCVTGFGGRGGPGGGGGPGTNPSGAAGNA